MPRIFIAIALPSDVAAALSAALPESAELRRVPPENMHVTLAFLGQVGEERVPDIIAAVRVAAARCGPFDVELRTVGRFPEHGRPRVVWAGAGPRATDAVVQLGASVRAELLRHGVPFDPKPLRAHVTLARVRDEVGEDGSRAILAAVAAATLARHLGFRAASVHVMESRLLPSGPLYSSRAESALTGPPGGIDGGTR